MPTRKETARLRRRRHLIRQLRLANPQSFAPQASKMTGIVHTPNTHVNHFRVLVISVSGHYGDCSHRDIKNLIEGSGATYCGKATPQCTHFITTEKELANQSPKVIKALNVYSCEIVSIDWLIASHGAGKPLPEGPYRVRMKKKSTGNSLPGQIAGMKRLLDEGTDLEMDSIAKKRKMDFVTSTDKLIIPAHEACPFKHEYSIAIDMYGHPWDAKLIRSEPDGGKNDFYHLQLLVHKSEQLYVSWACWGKVGAGPNQLKPTPCDPEKARDDFEKRFQEKTSFSWWKRFDEQAREDKYRYVPPPYITRNPDDNPFALDNMKRMGYSNVPKPVCTVDPAVQRVVAFILNKDDVCAESASSAYDKRKLPLGQLNRQMLMQGQDILQKLSKLIIDGSDVIVPEARRLSSEYFALIPHVFGRHGPPVIKSQRDIEKETELLDELANAVVANEIVKSAKSNYVSPIEKELHALGLESIVPLSSRSTEFRSIKAYFDRTSDPHYLHPPYNVIDVFRIRRPGEEARFLSSPYANLPSSNRRLLWHGSRTIHFAGILSKGLHIHPPGATYSGSALGNGIYFSDTAGKAMNYSCLKGSGRLDTGLLLLCDVELGNPINRVRTFDPYREPGTIATQLCHGSAPFTAFVDGNVITPRLAGVKVPNVSGRQNLFHHMSEYVVFDVAQVQIRYLVYVKRGV